MIMTKHHSVDEVRQPPTDTLPYDHPKRKRKRLMGRLTLWGAIFVVASGLATTFGWFGGFYEITKCPGRLDKVEAEQEKDKQDRAEIRESLARIEGALNIRRSPRGKEQNPTP